MRAQWHAANHWDIRKVWTYGWCKYCVVTISIKRPLTFSKYHQQFHRRALVGLQINNMKFSGNLGKAYYTAVNSLRQPKAFSFIFQWVQLFLALGQTVDQNLIIMLFPSKMLTKLGLVTNIPCIRWSGKFIASSCKIILE